MIALSSLAVGRAAAAVALLGAAALAFLAAGRGAGAGPGREEPAQAPARAATFRRDPGTAVLGMGLLRVSPARGDGQGRVRLRYAERPTAYAAFDAVQLLVVPAEAFAKEGRAFAGDCLAWTRSKPGIHEVQVSWTVSAPAVLVVGYGPYEGPDSGRPLSLARTVSLEVVSAHDANARFVEPEAGELNAKSWTAFPEVSRGSPFRDPAGATEAWFELRPLVVYDRAWIRGADERDEHARAPLLREAEALRARAEAARRDGKADVAAELAREAASLVRESEAADERIPVPAALAERLRRPPLRWK